MLLVIDRDKAGKRSLQPQCAKRLKNRDQGQAIRERAKFSLREIAYKRYLGDEV